MLITINAQQAPPELISYRAIAYNNSGNIITGTTIGIKVTILNNSTEIYSERHVLQTAADGSYNLQIGGGIFLTGTSFSEIDWSTSTKFLKIEIDPTGGTNYTVSVGETQLLTVPYAFLAKKALTAESLENGIDTVENIDALENINVFQNGKVVYVKNYEISGDEGGGIFIYRSNDSRAIDDGIIIKSENTPDNGKWIRQYTGSINVKWFGAKNRREQDSDQTKYFNKAIQAAYNHQYFDSFYTGTEDGFKQRAVFIPSGDYVIEGSILLKDGVKLEGEGIDLTFLHRINGSPTIPIIKNEGFINSIGLYNFSVNGNNNIAIDIYNSPINMQNIRVGTFGIAIRLNNVSHGVFTNVFTSSNDIAFQFNGQNENSGVCTFSNCLFGPSVGNQIQNQRIGFEFGEGATLDSFVFNSCFFSGNEACEKISYRDVDEGAGIRSVMHNACHYELKESGATSEAAAVLFEGGPAFPSVTYGTSIGVSWNACNFGLNGAKYGFRFKKARYEGISINNCDFLFLPSNSHLFSFENGTFFKNCEINGLTTDNYNYFDNLDPLWLEGNTSSPYGERGGWKLNIEGLNHFQNGLSIGKLKNNPITNKLYSQRITSGNINIDQWSVYFNKGDLIYNDDPDVGEYIGWVCVEEGFWGSCTWKRFGLIVN